MSQLASASQLRMSLLRWALFVIPAVELLGFLSGAISGSWDDIGWYATLLKPAAQPPAWIFPIAWTTFYFMIGLAFAIVLHARGAHNRGLAILLFIIQFAFTLAWPLVFFGQHKVSAAFFIAVAMVVSATATTVVFGRVRKSAAWLMVPYLVWISFAAVLNYQIDRLNPDAESLYVPDANTQIGSIG